VLDGGTNQYSSKQTCHSKTYGVSAGGYRHSSNCEDPTVPAKFGKCFNTQAHFQPFIKSYRCEFVQNGVSISVFSSLVKVCPSARICNLLVTTITEVYMPILLQTFKGYCGLAATIPCLHNRSGSPIIQLRVRHAVRLQCSS
jgi:hypothetical protein